MNDYKELIERLKSIGKYLNFDKSSCVYLAADAIEQLVRERDAAVKDLNIARSCLTCKSSGLDFSGLDFCKGCDSWASKSNWEWRGAK